MGVTCAYLELNPKFLAKNRDPFFLGCEAPFFSVTFRCHKQLHLGQSDSTVGSGLGTDAVLGEVGLGRGLVIMTHARKFFEAVRLQRERVLWTPTSIRFCFLHAPAIVVLNQAKHSGGIPLLGPGLEAKRLHERIAESDISQPRVLEINSEYEVIKLRTLAAIGSRATRAESSVTSKPSVRRSAAKAPFSS